MIGKQNRDALYFCCIFEASVVSHIFYKKVLSLAAIHKVRTQVEGGGERLSVQKRTGAYKGGVMEREYIRSLTIFLLYFFALKCADFTNTYSKNIYEQIFK